MTADLGGAQRLPKLMPLGIVKELAYTGRRLSAQKPPATAWSTPFMNRPRPPLPQHWPAHAGAAKPPSPSGAKQVINYARDSVRLAAHNRGLGAKRHLEQPPCDATVGAMQAKREGDFPPLEPLHTLPQPPTKTDGNC